MRGAALEFRDVAKSYGELSVLQPTSLHIEPGEFFALLGPSGSGKSTLLGTVAGFVPLSSGSIVLDGQAINSRPPHKRNIGMVFQNYSLFPFRTVAQNVAFPLEMRGASKQEAQAKVEAMLAMVQLGHLGDRLPKQLSGGQQQRVALARAAVYDPPLLLMDEPLGALDKKLREGMQDEIKAFHRKVGSTVLYVTHDQEEAAAMADRMAIMNRGRLEQVGTPRELYDEPRNAFVANFLGEANLFRLRDGASSGALVETQSGLSLKTGHVAAHPGPCFACVRPENIQLSEGSAASDNSFSGGIEDAVHLAGVVKYRIRLNPNCSVIVRAASERGARLHDLGETVSVTWKAKDTLIIPE
ncbi:ABC transporter ATP-binding protein [Bosea sp. (in: a-proteobacteria)]|jgi:putative spermidine/putrescine transport system ATP-binding protein|uniref:ABC transporter ATP-binding protein n=1 Tax=Bosea sp. (in: a-proteobacteria) TaxID=1871050 RepID=UPI002DDD07CD|nr:ABC transporter ATP-binding protein [Bosea sp. (in: a-proteobacteria)]HEV2512087.1 ABC transporter ATP-binding protein [Bosea sp. (in: a-proteobacteria)]